MDKNINPKVSVLMPVFNAAPYVKEAIQSVLDQTFQDYEFIIVDDGSTDASLQVIQSFTDPRIKLIEHHTNAGLIATLNEGLQRADGEFIARIDADDIWTSKDKLAKQLEHFDHSPDCVLVGTWATVIDEDGAVHGKIRYPYEDAAIRNNLLMKNYFIHPSVMFKKEAALAVGGFKAEEKHVEDYGLWLRLGARGTFANISEYLMSYRVHGASVSRQNRMEQIRNSFILIKQFSSVYPNYTLASWKWHLKLFLEQF